MASTLARTKPSKMLRISSYSIAFSRAMPACAASVCRSCSLRSSKGTTMRSASSLESSFCDGSRFLLMSCSTPITSPPLDTNGVHSMLLVR